MGFEFGPGFESQPCHLLAVGGKAKSLTSLRARFLICKLGLRTVLTGKARRLDCVALSHCHFSHEGWAMRPFPCAFTPLLAYFREAQGALPNLPRNPSCRPTTCCTHSKEGAAHLWGWH